MPKKRAPELRNLRCTEVDMRRLDILGPVCKFARTDFLATGMKRTPDPSPFPPVEKHIGYFWVTGLLLGYFWLKVQTLKELGYDEFPFPFSLHSLHPSRRKKNSARNGSGKRRVYDKAGLKVLV